MTSVSRAALLLAIAGCGRIGFDAAGVSGDGGGSAQDAGVPIEGNAVFVTSSLHIPGTLGTLAAADAVCMARASEAGLAGTFVAWMSTTAINARERLGAARGWYRVDGKPVVDTTIDLATGQLLHPIRLDEHGRDLDEDYTYYAATGTFGGTLNQNCGDLTNIGDVIRSGYPQFAGTGWTGSNGISCSQLAHLYCFQIDYTRQLTFAPASGRRAFLSASAFTPSTGLAGADAVCAADASAASLIGTFKALLPATQPAAARFDALGPPWVRLDGIPLAPTANALLSGASIAPFNMTADGTILDAYAMTGLDGATAYDPPDPLRTCDAWTNPNGTGEDGYAASTGTAMFTRSTVGCAAAMRVYCLEE